MVSIGPYTLHAIETGRLGLDGGAMFGIIPKPLWERRIPADDRNRIPLHMRCLLLEGAGRLILIDNGVGDKFDRRFADIYAIDFSEHSLDRSLAAAGFSRGDVTDVILTHLHFDHCGGSTRRAGDRLEVAFERATFHVQRDHWAWARESNPRERASFLAENLEPLKASGQLNLIDGPGEILPGLDALVVNGHTEAQQVVKISGEEGTLVYVADLLPTAAHLAPAWGLAYDLRPLVTIEETGAFLDEAVEQGWQLFFEHDASVVVAGLQRNERGTVETVDPRPLSALWGAAGT
jgi:glyoxylase-like metal-dependent hydrolase (beta-lactamase superfamily II)